MVPGGPDAAIRASDVLLHHPFQSFATVVDFVRRVEGCEGDIAIKTSSGGLVLLDASAMREANRRIEFWILR